MTDKVRLVWILSDLFLFIYSNSKKWKNIRISKMLISHYLNNFLPSQIYGMQIIHITIIKHWNTYNIPWSSYLVFNGSVSAGFDIFVSLFPLFYRIPHLNIVFRCNFITRYVYWYFTISIRSSIVSQFKPNCIIKSLYCQTSPKHILGFTTSYFLKWPGARAVLTSDTEIYQSKLWSVQNLVVRVLSK